MTKETVGKYTTPMLISTITALASFIALQVWSLNQNAATLTTKIDYLAEAIKRVEASGIKLDSRISTMESDLAVKTASRWTKLDQDRYDSQRIAPLIYRLERLERVLDASNSK